MTKQIPFRNDAVNSSVLVGMKIISVSAINGRAISTSCVSHSLQPTEVPTHWRVIFANKRITEGLGQQLKYETYVSEIRTRVKEEAWNEIEKQNRVRFLTN